MFAVSKNSGFVSSTNTRTGSASVALYLLPTTSRTSTPVTLYPLLPSISLPSVAFNLPSVSFSLYVFASVISAATCLPFTYMPFTEVLAS